MGQFTEPRPSCYLALLSVDSKIRHQWRQPQLRDLTHIVCEKGAILSTPHMCSIRPMRINFSNSTQWNRISEDNWLVEAQQHFESWVFSLTSNNDSWQEQSRCGLRGHIHNNSPYNQVMAWSRQVASHYLSRREQPFMASHDMILLALNESN